MLLDYEQRISAAVSKAIYKLYGISITVVVEQPKDPSHGELAIPVAFQLARRLKKPPIQIAQDIVRELCVLGEDFNVSRL